MRHTESSPHPNPDVVPLKKKRKLLGKSYSRIGLMSGCLQDSFAPVLTLILFYPHMKGNSSIPLSSCLLLAVCRC